MQNIEVKSLPITLAQFKALVGEFRFGEKYARY